MKKHYLALIVSILFVVSLCNTAMAVDDFTGDNLVPGVDLASASVQTFAPQGPGVPPEYIKLGIRMNAGSHLPTLIIWDFDVDNDTATGDGSIVTGIPNNTCGGQPCKADAGGGFDFYAVMALRKQADTSSTALCMNCARSVSQCATHVVPHLPVMKVPAMSWAASCDIGDPDCYETDSSMYRLSRIGAILPMIKSLWYYCRKLCNGALKGRMVHVNWTLQENPMRGEEAFCLYRGVKMIILNGASRCHGTT